MLNPFWKTLFWDRGASISCLFANLMRLLLNFPSTRKHGLIGQPPILPDFVNVLSLRNVVPKSVGRVELKKLCRDLWLRLNLKCKTAEVLDNHALFN